MKSRHNICTRVQRELQSSAGFGSVAERLHEAYHKKKFHLLLYELTELTPKRGLCVLLHIFMSI